MKIKSRKTYCDTSVFGGVYDSEFAEVSKKFLKLAEVGVFDLVVSAVVDEEINDPITPQQVKDQYQKCLKFAEIAEVNEEALFLQAAYIKEKILTQKWEDDALHVALATVHQCDLIVSWNFKHIVNFKKIPLYNAVNTLYEYQQIQIYSPLEVVEIDEE